MLRVRVQQEFEAFPGLRLTRWQAARLWNLEFHECDVLLKRLVAARVLRETADGFAAGEAARAIQARMGGRHETQG
ncbi:MAG TPA: hypothetical protein VG106_03350, partial [Vicinamibacterales bacterium]|nr:hypothetical protein [Vicinamibacterales bacterium]